MSDEPNRITKLRTASGLSRPGVADRLGVTERTVYRWENGETAIPDHHKRALALLFGGVTIEHLMGWEDQSSSTGVAA